METDAPSLYGPRHVPSPRRDHRHGLRACDGTLDHLCPLGIDHVDLDFSTGDPEAEPDSIYTVTVATLVTMVELVLEGFLPDIHRVLGLFIPLIIVNCIILGRIESFAANHPPAGPGGHARVRPRLYVGVDGDRRGEGAPRGRDALWRPGDAGGFRAWSVMRTPAGAFWTMGAAVGSITLWRQRGSKKRTAVPGVGIEGGSGGGERGETA